MAEVVKIMIGGRKSSLWAPKILLHTGDFVNHPLEFADLTAQLFPKPRDAIVLKWYGFIPNPVSSRVSYTF